LKNEKDIVVGLFWLKWAGLLSIVLGSSILSMGVVTRQTATQFDPTCAQIMPRLPKARFTGDRTISDGLQQADMIITR